MTPEERAALMCRFTEIPEPLRLLVERQAADAIRAAHAEGRAAALEEAAELLRIESLTETGYGELGDYAEYLAERIRAIIASSPLAGEPAIRDTTGDPEPELLSLVGKLAEAECSLHCPSTWRTGEPQPHTDLCRQARARARKP